MGMSLRPEDKPVHITAGIEESNISAKYYEPPLMQVIPSACASCEEREYEVSNMCKGCLAHPCRQVCPVGAISMKNGKSYIDQCQNASNAGNAKRPVHMMQLQKRNVHARNPVASMQLHRINLEERRSTMTNVWLAVCVWWHVHLERSQINLRFSSLPVPWREGGEIIAAIAPAFVGQFGPNITPRNIKAALQMLGFKEVYEVALGADIGAISEAHHYVEKVVTGELPFLLTSCCPSWSMLCKKYFPDLVDQVSEELTPMVATARTIKKEHPNARVVFIGPWCV